MLVLFGLSAALQINDADGLLWGLIYLGAGFLCGLWHRGMLSRRISGMAGICALLAALYWASMISGSTEMAGLFSWNMTDSTSEIVRESGGLGLVSLWMGLLSFWTD